MVIRGKPVDISLYIKVSNDDSDKLHKAGYCPAYMDDEYVYYKKTETFLSNYKTILGLEEQ